VGPAKVADEIVVCGFWLCLAQTAQDFRTLLQEPNPGISFDDFRVLIGGNDASGCVGMVKVSNDATRDNFDDRLSVQGCRGCCVNGNRVLDLLKSLLVPFRVVALGVGPDKFTGRICAVDFETLVR
jgi:hypothetical protein